MNKWYLVIAVFTLIITGIAIAVETDLIENPLGGLTSTKIDYNLTLAPEKSQPTDTINKTILDKTNYTITECNEKTCTMILNKTGLFQDHKITFNTQQECTSYEQVCSTYSDKECLEMEQAPVIECIKLTNPEEPFNPEKNPCIEWEDYKTKGCLEFDEKTGECIVWEKEFSCLKWSEASCLSYANGDCLSWSNFSRDYFAQKAILGEIEKINFDRNSLKSVVAVQSGVINVK